MSFRIESGIPIPAKHFKKTKRYPWADMKVGDSFGVKKNGKKHQAAAISACAAQWADGHGKNAKFSLRTVNGGYRIWRIK